ncbi:hypothetical protein UT300005_14430 [Clostridium sp. CTA-5]
MRNMRKHIANTGERLGDKIINELCTFSIKVGEKSRGRCAAFSAYEPKIPMELLREEK